MAEEEVSKASVLWNVEVVKAKRENDHVLPDSTVLFCAKTCCLGLCVTFEVDPTSSVTCFIDFGAQQCVIDDCDCYLVASC